MSAGTVRAVGAQIAWRIDGDDRLPTLILSNSLGADRSMWQSQVNVIKRRFRILRYDTRGHGASGAGNSDYGIERLGRDVLAIMDGLGVARAHFCGLSLGGMTGMWLGVNAPERIDRLVLANTAAHIGPADMWLQRADAVQKGGMQAIVEGVLKRWFTAGFLAGNGSVVNEARAMLLATPPEGYARACRMLAVMDQRETVSGIRAPTLVIAGLQDAATPPADAKFLAEKIRHVQLVELDAAHLSNMERANEFTRAVEHFLLN